jgi:D-alanyl-D-alanine carboxypeptidase/D-alanyl-D-alanine-endopeptidase (penicillin-binding protein 4)
MYGFYTPDFMCRLLRAIGAHPIGAGLRRCLPVLGRDGTLHDIVRGSAAAGHVFAKTGTLGFDDRLRPRTMVQAKGLAGYIDAASGGKFVFAAYLNNLPLEPGQTWSHAGNLLGEVAAAAFHLL